MQHYAQASASRRANRMLSKAPVSLRALQRGLGRKADSKQEGEVGLETLQAVIRQWPHPTGS